MREIKSQWTESSARLSNDIKNFFDVGTKHLCNRVNALSIVVSISFIKHTERNMSFHHISPSVIMCFCFICVVSFAIWLFSILYMQEMFAVFVSKLLYWLYTFVMRNCWFEWKWRVRPTHNNRRLIDLCPVHSTLWKSGGNFSNRFSNHSHTHVTIYVNTKIKAKVLKKCVAFSVQFYSIYTT